MIIGSARPRRCGSTARTGRSVWRGGALMLAVGMNLTACTGFGGAGGELRAESLVGDPVVLKANYVAAVYSHGQAPETSFFLTDVPIQSLLTDARATAQIVNIELLWEPKPGATPLESDATNASIRYVVIVGKEVGVYGGAGFVMPQGTTGDKHLSLSVRDASLKLLESTESFVDVLGLAQLTGQFTAVRDDALARQVRYAVSQRVTDALGRSTLVDLGLGREFLVALTANDECPGK